MSRKTEKIFKEFHKYIENMDIKDEKELEKEFGKFIEKYNTEELPIQDDDVLDADDYLEMAIDAETEEEAIEYAKMALKEDKDCVDAKLLLLQFEEDVEKIKDQLEKIIEVEAKRLKEEGFFAEEDIGHFYGILETRPYIRDRKSTRLNSSH